MKLGPNYRVQVSVRVHVSRIVITPFTAARTVLERTSDASAPDDHAHCSSLLLRNSRHSVIDARFYFTGAESSLLPPRHRGQALLSSAM
jgi:hypothetical protein